MIKLQYFDFFPTVNYDLDKDGITNLATNIMHRFKIREILKTKAVIFYTYDIKDGERPDHVADKFYGRAKMEWLILITNNILDPHFEWPMDHWQFTKFVIDKYGSLSDAHQTIHHYEKIINEETELDSGRIMPEYHIIIDKAEYLTTVDSYRRSVSMYDYEKDLNESRRTIKIIHESYVPQIMKEIRNIF